MADVKLYQSKVWMTLQYQNNKKTPEELAKICGCNVKTIYRYLRQHELLREK